MFVSVPCDVEVLSKLRRCGLATCFKRVSGTSDFIQLFGSAVLRAPTAPSRTPQPPVPQPIPVRRYTTWQVAIVHQSIKKGVRAQEACGMLIAKAAMAWKRNEPDYRDDITAIVVHLPPVVEMLEREVSAIINQRLIN